MSTPEQTQKSHPVRVHKKPARGASKRAVRSLHNRDHSSARVDGKLRKRGRSTMPTKQADHMRDVTEAGAEQTKELLQRMGSASTQAASTMQTCCSTALKG